MLKVVPLREIPVPAPYCVSVAGIPRPVISLYEIFSFENGIAAEEEMSALPIVPSTIFAPVTLLFATDVAATPVNCEPLPAKAFAVTVPAKLLVITEASILKVFPLSEIPVPAPYCVSVPGIPRLVISAYEIFNLENGIAAEEEISALPIVPSTIFAPVTLLFATDVAATPVNCEPSPAKAFAVTVPG